MTYTVSNGTGVYGCAARGTESLDPADLPLINQTLARLESMGPTVQGLMPSSQPTAARYCGQYTATLPSGAITGSNGTVGIAGAASLCASLTTCGSSARMCTVYDHAARDGAPATQPAIPA